MIQGDGVNFLPYEPRRCACCRAELRVNETGHFAGKPLCDLCMAAQDLGLLETWDGESEVPLRKPVAEPHGKEFGE